MKKSSQGLRFLIGPGALLALLMAMTVVAEGQVIGRMTPDEECARSEFCVGRDDGGGYQDEFPGGSEDDYQEDVFTDGSRGGRIGCPDPNPYDPPGRGCDDGRRPGRPHRPGPGHHGPAQISERLNIYRLTSFEGLELNMMLGQMIYNLRGYELSRVIVNVADRVERDIRGGRESLTLLVSGQIHDSARVYGRSGQFSYGLRPQYGIDMSPRGERVQVLVNGQVFITDIQLVFTRRGGGFGPR